VVIPKAGDIMHVRENATTSGWKLSAKYIQEIDRAFQ
jgi:diketogulonate reductase-like aldo/keto reductase